MSIRLPHSRADFGPHPRFPSSLLPHILALLFPHFRFFAAESSSPGNPSYENSRCFGVRSGKYPSPSSRLEVKWFFRQRSGILLHHHRCRRETTSSRWWITSHSVAFFYRYRGFLRRGTACAINPVAFVFIWEFLAVNALDVVCSPKNSLCFVASLHRRRSFLRRGTRRRRRLTADGGTPSTRSTMATRRQWLPTTTTTTKPTGQPRSSVTSSAVPPSTQSRARPPAAIVSSPWQRARTPVTHDVIKSRRYHLSFRSAAFYLRYATEIKLCPPPDTFYSAHCSSRQRIKHVGITCDHLVRFHSFRDRLHDEASSTGALTNIRTFTFALHT